MSANNTIILKGRPIYEEGTAGGTITPGHLLYYSAANTVAVHATAGGDAAGMFALAAEFEGTGISTNYASGDRVAFCHARPGDEIYALLPAYATAVAVNDPLESNGDGCLRKHTAKAWAVGTTESIAETQYSKIIQARALEAVDNSAGAAVARIKVVVT